MNVRFRPVPVLALLLCALVSPVRAQEATDSVVVEGRVIGPTGAALDGQVVVLHRVAAGSGATVATDTTGASGGFVLVARGLAPAADATYFVAARYQGELYIGAPFQLPLPDGVDYTVQVGVPGTSASAMMGGAPPPTQAPAGAVDEPFPYTMWLFLIIPLLVMALAAGYMLTRRRTPATRRRLLMQVADLDETHDAELAAGHVADSTLYWAERRALLEQLTRAS